MPAAVWRAPTSNTLTPTGVVATWLFIVPTSRIERIQRLTISLTSRDTNFQQLEDHCTANRTCAALPQTALGWVRCGVVVFFSLRIERRYKDISSRREERDDRTGLLGAIDRASLLKLRIEYLRRLPISKVVWGIAGHFFASEHTTSGSATIVTKQKAGSHLHHAICSRFSLPNRSYFRSSHRHPFAHNTINPLIFLRPDSDLLQHKHSSKIFSPLLLKGPFHVCGYIPPLSGQQSRAS